MKYKIISFCILLVFAINAFAQQTEKDSVAKKDVFVCNFEKMPEFPGGNKALMEFLSENIRYPIEAQEAGIQGKVFVNFRVKPDGFIDEINVKKGVHKSLDNEAIRLIKLMPKWKPGLQDGKPISAYYTLPVTFKLNDKKNSK